MRAFLPQNLSETIFGIIFKWSILVNLYLTQSTTRAFLPLIRENSKEIFMYLAPHVRARIQAILLLAQRCLSTLRIDVPLCQ